jgi:hypothetical protein
MSIKSVKHQIIYSSSPEDLAQQLKSLGRNSSALKGHICLALEDARCHIRNFDLQKMSMHMLSQHVAFEAVDLLGRPLPEVVLDLQVCGSNDLTTNGYYACMPKTVMNEYLFVLQKHNLSADSVTLTALLRLNALALLQPATKGRFVCVDFSQPQHAYISIFDERCCELIRKFPYENEKQPLQEVIRSLQSVCAQSSSKKFDRVYLCGNIPDQSQFVQTLKNRFEVDIVIQNIDLPSVDDSLKHHFCSLNLLRSSQLSQSMKAWVCGVLQATVGLSVLAVVVLGILGTYNTHTIRSLKTSFSAADYQRALIVKQRMENRDGR